MKKIISFSLYGNNAKYCNGILCNVELASLIYPEWICRVYYGNSVSLDVINNLKGHGHVELISMDEGEEKLHPMIWRFLPIDDDDVSIMISRDADSRLTQRERNYVRIFEESDVILHDIRDSVHHDNIMGGLWGIKKHNRFKIKDLCSSYVGAKYNTDQQFLREKILPLLQDTHMIHCSYYLKNIPAINNDFFMGNVWPADNYGKPYDYIFC